MPSISIGVDPGISGAICGLEETTGRVAWIVDMPLYEGPRGEEVDTRRLADVLNDARARVIVIEDVHGIPGNGAKSLFNFGRAYGALLGTLHYLRMPFHRVRPQVWQGTMFPRAGLTEQHNTKEASRFTALKLFPQAPLIRGRGKKPDHNRSDATLIAAYASLSYPNTTACDRTRKGGK
jgi:hypothetical protein